MIRIHVADHAEADAAWRMLCTVPDGTFQPVEMHLDDHGPLHRVIRTEEGEQTTAPPAADPARSCPA
jgi:hypothetical protein